jgi:hypothetical protein
MARILPRKPARAKASGLTAGRSRPAASWSAAAAAVRGERHAAEPAHGRQRLGVEQRVRGGPDDDGAVDLAARVTRTSSCTRPLTPHAGRPPDSAARRRSGCAAAVSTPRTPRDRPRRRPARRGRRHCPDGRRPRPEAPAAAGAALTDAFSRVPRPSRASSAPPPLADGAIAPVVPEPVSVDVECGALGGRPAAGGCRPLRWLAARRRLGLPRRIGGDGWDTAWAPVPSVAARPAIGGAGAGGPRGRRAMAWRRRPRRLATVLGGVGAGAACGPGSPDGPPPPEPPALSKPRPSTRSTNSMRGSVKPNAERTPSSSAACAMARAAAPRGSRPHLASLQPAGTPAAARCERRERRPSRRR